MDEVNQISDDRNARYKKSSDYSPVFVQLSPCVIMDDRISHSAKVMYSVLLGRLISAERRSDRNTWISQATISSDMGTCDRQIRRLLGELLAVGLISVEVESDRLGKTNMYHLVRLEKVYGDLIYLSCDELSKIRRESQGEDKNVRTPTPDKNVLGTPDKNVRTTPDKNVLLRRTTKEEELKDKNFSSQVSPASEITLAGEDSPIEGSEESPNREVQEIKPIDARKAALGVFGNKQTEAQVSTFGGKADKEEKDRQKAEVKKLKDAQRKEEIKAKATGSIPEGYSKADWERKTCSGRLFSVMAREMDLKGWPFPAKATKVDQAILIKVWEKVGDLEKAVSAISFTIRNWEHLKEKYRLTGYPGLTLFAGKYMDQLMIEAMRGSIKIADLDEIEKAMG